MGETTVRCIVLESVELSHQECETLLRSGVVGRVAVSTPAGPHIVPVNYSVVNDSITLRTSPYSLLGTYGRNTLLAFEVDYFDYAAQHGWSVLARGRAEVVTEPAELEHIRSNWAPRPWIRGARNLYLQLPWSDLSGRRIGTGWDLVAEMPVRRQLSS